MSPNFKDYEEFIKTRTENTDWYSAFLNVGTFFEGLGVLVKRGLVNKYMVDDLFSGYLLRYWEKYGPIAIEFRRRYNWPSAWEWVEYLYNEIRVIAVSQHPELAKKQITMQY